LKCNEGKSFQGSIPLGMGFTFDDTDTSGVTTPIAEMRRLIDIDRHNQQVISPFIGYAEVASDPTHSHNRYVINFQDFPLRRNALGAIWEKAEQDQREEWLMNGIVPLDYSDPVAADWPDLLDIVERKVKPERLAQKDEYGKRYWWRFLRTRPEMRAASRGLARVIVAGSQASTQYALAFLPQGIVYSSNLSVIAFETYAAFAALQSRVHEEWARFFMSTMKDDLAYTPTTCFEPFPFPSHWTTDTALESVGRAYYELRAAVMVKNDEGLTKTYNRFHDPEEQSEDFKALRALHHSMDRAVLDAYRWTDIQPVPQHEAEFEEEPTDEDDFSGAKKPKQKYRLRWPEDIRDDVLARLLVLNEQRAAAEAMEPKTKKKKSKHVASPLFDSGDQE